MYLDYIKNFIKYRTAASINSIKHKVQQDIKNNPKLFNGQTLNQIIQSIKNIVSKYVKEGSVQYNWFFDRYIIQDCHIQDFLDSLVKILEYLQKYSNLSKDNKNKLPLTKETSFNDLIEFINKSANLIKNLLEKPNLNQIHVPESGQYHIYTLDKDDLSAYNEMHNKYSNYVSWCVVKGTVTWGTYLNSKYHCYYFITDEKYNPILLMNFSDGRNAQIKNVHNQFFGYYNETLFKIIDYLIQKDGFDPENKGDFKTYLKIKNLFQQKITLNQLNLMTTINDLEFYEGKNKQQNKDFYIYKNGKCVALILKNSNYIRIGNIKFTKDILQFVDKYTDIEIDYFCANLLFSKIITQTDINVFDDVFKQSFTYCKDNRILGYVIKNKIVTKKRNDLLSKIIQSMRHDEIVQIDLKNNLQLFDFSQPYMEKILNHLSYNLSEIIQKYPELIKNQNTIDIIKNIIINQRMDMKVVQLLVKNGIIDKNKDDDYNNELIDCFISNGIYIDNIIEIFNLEPEQPFFEKLINKIKNKYPHRLIQSDLIKQNSSYKQDAINKMIENQDIDHLYSFIRNNTITKRNKKYKQIINMLSTSDNIKNDNFVLLLKEKRITQQDQFFDQIVLKLAESRGYFIYELADSKIIDSNYKYFDNLMMQLANCSYQYILKLVFNGIIKDLNKDYVKKSIQMCIENYYPDNYNIKKDLFYLLISKGIVNATNEDVFYDQIINILEDKGKTILYYLFFDQFIKNTQPKFLSTLKKLKIQMIFRLYKYHKIVTNIPQTKNIVRFIFSQGYIHTLYVLMKGQAFNDNIKQYIIKMFLNGKNISQYYLYNIIIDKIIDQNNPLFEKCVDRLIQNNFLKVGMKTVLKYIYSNEQLKKKIINYIDSKNKLSHKLFKISKLLVSSNSFNFYKTALNIFKHIKLTKLAMKLSTKHKQEISQNNAILILKLENIDFVKRIDIKLLYNEQNKKIDFVCNVICDNNILDDKFYLPIKSKLSSIDKTFDLENIYQKLTQHIDNHFNDFYNLFIHKKRKENRND